MKSILMRFERCLKFAKHTKFKKIKFLLGILTFAVIAIIIEIFNLEYKIYKINQVFTKNESVTATNIELHHKNNYLDKLILERTNSIYSLEELKELKIKKQLFNDLNQYSHLEQDDLFKIINAVYINSEKYNLNPIFVYSVIWKESRFKNDVNHKITFVKALNKEVQAIGVGGVVWEFWSKRLIENTSIEKKDDLYNFDKNIEATAYILSYLKELPNVGTLNNKRESALARYYGKYQENYVSQIMNKFKTIQSMDF